MLFDLKTTSAHHIYNLLIGLVAPRPIALITSQDEEGRLNAAPFSAYNYLSADPPIVGIGIQRRPGTDVSKDTTHNIKATGTFVINVVTEDIAEAMNVCSTDFPAGVNELTMAGLTTTPSAYISVPRIAEAHAALECRKHSIIDIGRTEIVLGEVIALHVEDRFVDPKGPYIVAEELHAVGRMNGLGKYVHTRDAFLEIPRISYEKWQKGERPGKPLKSS
jgi:flavin reductase (DIM6/NTAB) family NADH-FMN oxidoreductase RutF